MGRLAWKPAAYYRSEGYAGPLAESVKIDTYESCPDVQMWYIPATNPVPEHAVGQKGRLPGEIRHGDRQTYLGNGQYILEPT